MFLSEFERQLAAGGPIRLLALKARQLGLTTLSVGLIVWRTITHPLVHSLSMSDEDERTLTNFDMARSAHENLPWWFRPEKRYDERGHILGFDRAKEADRLRSPGLQSHIQFESANQPSGAAYSKALYCVHLAEVSRYRKADAITEGVYGSLTDAPGSIGIMESTARGRNNTWHYLCRSSESGRLRWKFVFMEWFREPGYKLMIQMNWKASEEETAYQKKVKEETGYLLSNEQMEWRRQKLEEYESTEGNPEKFYQEYPSTPVEAFISSGMCAFSKKRLRDMITHFVRPAPWTGEISLNADNRTPKLIPVEDGRLKVWEWPKANETYYVSGDPSLGIEGGDPACVQVLCVPEDLSKPIRQVARWHGWIGPTMLARICAALGYLYNTAEVSVECNTITTVISDLGKVLMYPKWYRWMREDKAKNAYSNYMGWQTTSRNRNELISRFRESLDQWTMLIRDSEAIDECFDFVDDEGTGHYEGRKNDDHVMSLMIGYYCATQLRPRIDTDLVENKVPAGHDFINTDFSPLYDDPENYFSPADPSLPKFDEL